MIAKSSCPKVLCCFHVLEETDNRAENLEEEKTIKCINFCLAFENKITIIRTTTSKTTNLNKFELAYQNV